MKLVLFVTSPNRSILDPRVTAQIWDNQNRNTLAYSINLVEGKKDRRSKFIWTCVTNCNRWSPETRRYLDENDILFPFRLSNNSNFVHLISAAAMDHRSFPYCAIQQSAHTYTILHTRTRTKLNGTRGRGREEERNVGWYQRFNREIKTTPLKDGKRGWFNRWNVMET